MIKVEQFTARAGDSGGMELMEYTDPVAKELWEHLDRGVTVNQLAITPTVELTTYTANYHKNGMVILYRAEPDHSQTRKGYWFIHGLIIRQIDWNEMVGFELHSLLAGYGCRPTGLKTIKLHP